MTHVVVCEVRPDAMEHLKVLRLQHLQYIDSNKERILLGGPARNENDMPQTMIIVLKTDDIDEAKNFIMSEPYTASGKVFSAVSVRKWSQLVPDRFPNALKEEIAAESQRNVMKDKT